MCSDVAQLGDRSLFPTLEARAYLNHAAISPLSAPVVRALESSVAGYAAKGLDALPQHLEQRERLRGKLAQLVGVTPETIGLCPTTSWGVIFVAQSFPWNRGDGVMVLGGEFPANVTPWQRAAETHGLDLVTLDAAAFCSPDPGLGLSQLDKALAGGVKLVAVSAVQFQTGARMPLLAMSMLCHRHGAALFVDAIQACGVVPLDLKALGVDFAACGGHKWLMGCEGTGFVYVADAWAQRLRPNLAGWLSHDDGLGFLFEGPGHLRYDRGFRPGAGLVEVGAQPALGFAGLEPAVDLITQLGVDEIYAHVQRYHDALEPRLEALGFRSLRSPSPAERSGTLSMQPPDGVDVTTLPARARELCVAISIPDGVVRFAPHWPNAIDEVDVVADALASLVG